MPLIRSPRSRLLAIPAVALALGLAPSVASAGVLVESAASCDEQPLSQPFLPWLDIASYTPAPDGTLEAGGAGWTLSGARVVAGNEPFQVAGDGGTRSLRISPGGWAATRPICVGVEHPTIRFFAKRSGGLLDSLSSLRVDVLYENHLGVLEELPVGVVLGGTSWSATLPQVVLANLLPLLPGDRTPVAFRFSAQGSATWQIDDVFVDPWRSN